MKVRSLLEGAPNRPGLHEIADDATLDVLDGTHRVLHPNIQGCWPPDLVLESGYRTGPVIAYHLRDGIADLDNGAIFDREGALIRESFGPVTMAERYLRNAQLPDLEKIATSPRTLLPLGNPRARNACHWYLDTLGKVFVSTRSRLAPLRPEPILYRARAGFQRDSLKLLDGQPWQPDTPRFVRGDLIGTPGINSGGSPRISQLVADYADDLAMRLRSTFGDVPGVGPRIFVSRQGATNRSIVNEAALRDELAQDGFVSIELERLSAIEQMAAFAHAEIVISPHGAGLIHMLWTPRKTKVVEMFPEGGVHGSIYLRIASRRRQPYFAVTGRPVGNRDHKANPKNADFELDLPNVLEFIRTRVLT